jgi:adenylate cyclase class 2
MAANNEVEIKFIVPDLEALRQTLRGSGFREVTPRTHEMNTLYDTPSQDLRKRGDLLRLRLYGNRWILTHKSKGSQGRHKSRTELETGIADGEQMDAILRALGYTPSFRYEKFRAEWTDGAGHVVLDETPIGNLAEIEGPPDWIDRTAARLGVSESDYITSNYATLFFEWKARTRSAAKEMTFEAVAETKCTSVSRNKDGFSPQ